LHDEEFYIGGEKEGKQCRSKGGKILVIVALEIVEGGVNQAYAQIISDVSNIASRPFFETHINKDAKIVTDVWKGYVPLKKYCPKLEQMKSEKGKNFPDVH
jgi:hypothetical protein